MKISDYANQKYANGKERDSFYQRWKGYDLEKTPSLFFMYLTGNSDQSFISNGISILGELEIREPELEENVLSFCSELLSVGDFPERNSGKDDVFESILWVLGEIGSIDSLEFLRDLIYNSIEKKRDYGNFGHLISACQYSFYRINQRELADFFIKIRSLKEIPVKTQAEIETLRKLNPKYADFQQFLLDNYKKYEGGGLN